MKNQNLSNMETLVGGQSAAVRDAQAQPQYPSSVQPLPIRQVPQSVYISGSYLPSYWTYFTPDPPAQPQMSYDSTGE